MFQEYNFVKSEKQKGEKYDFEQEQKTSVHVRLEGKITRRNMETTCCYQLP